MRRSWAGVQEAFGGYAVKCPTCATIGRRLHVDHDENQRLPDGVRAYRTLGRREDLRCCPHCGTSFRYAEVTDNDIYCPQHTETLTEVTDREVGEQLELERRESEEYCEAFNARFRKVLLTLSAGEREVLDYLLERWWTRQNLATLKSECTGGTAMPVLLSGLVAKGLVEEAKHGALLVGKDGKCWSQESQDWNITYGLTLSGHDLDEWRKRRRASGDPPPP